MAHDGQSDQSFGAVAIRHSGESLGRGLVNFRPLFFGAGDQFPLMFAQVECRAVIHFGQFDSRIHGPGKFAVAFKDGHAFAVAFPPFTEGADPFDLRILDASNQHN